MTDLERLSAYLNSLLPHITLTAEDGHLPEELREAVGTAPGRKVSLVLQRDGLACSGSVLEIRGGSEDVWPIQGLDDASVALAEVLIRLENGAQETVVSWSAKGTASFSCGLKLGVQLRRVEGQAGAWRLTLDQDAPLSALQLMQICGELPFAPPEKLNFMNDAVNVCKDRFAVTFYPNTETTFCEEFGLSSSASLELIPGLLCFQGLEIWVNADTFGFCINLVGRLKIGSIEMKAGAGVSFTEEWTVWLVPAPPAETFPGLADITAWLATACNIKNGEIGDAFGRLKLPADAFDAAVSAVRVRVNAREFTFIGLLLDSVIRIGALELGVTLSLPESAVRGGMRNKESLKASDLLQSLLPETGALPGELTVVSADFYAALREGHYGLYLALAGVWRVGPVSLDSLALLLRYRDELSGSIRGHISLGDTHVKMSAEYRSPDAGWCFSGGLDHGSTLKMEDVTRLLEETFGVREVPAAVRSLRLASFSMECQTGTGDFDLRCGGSIEVDDREVEITAAIALTHRSSGYSGFFSGEVVLAGHVFDMAFYEDADTDMIIASYQQTKQEKCKLGDLIAGVSARAARAIPDSLELGLEEAKFVFYRTAGEKKFTLALCPGMEIGLSNLPLLGGQLPPGFSLGVGRLQVGYASAAFTGEEAEQINARLPAALSPLAADGLSAGVYLSGDLMVGGTPLPLLLAAGAAETKDGKEDSPAPSQEEKIKWIDVQKQFGFLQFRRVGITLEDNNLLFLLDASLLLGPVTLSLDGLTAGASLSGSTPVFELRGLGIAYNQPPLRISGAILKVRPAAGVSFQYDGMVTIQAEKWTMTGIASYAQIGDGLPAFFVFARLEGALGGLPAFRIEGLMGGFGFNRELALPSLEELPDFPLLDGGAARAGGRKEDALAVLQVLEGRAASPSGRIKQWIAPRPGSYWLAAGMRFSSFELIYGNLLAVAEFGDDLHFSLLGLAWMRLPQQASDEQSYVYAELKIAAVLRPGEGILSIRSELTPDSYLLTKDCRLTGGIAFCLWFGDNPHAGQFVLTIGGYHPAFRAPDFYPSVPEVGFNWAVSEGVTIKGETYFALTPSCGMAGGSLEVLFARGNLCAWFTAHANLLVAWSPFSFLAEISVEIGVCCRLELLCCHKTITLSLGAALTLWGPPLGGRVKVHLSFISFTVHFGSDGALDRNYEPLAWQDFRALLPRDNICTIAAGAGLCNVLDRGDHEEIWVVRGGEFTFFTRSAIPASHVQLGDATQHDFTDESGGINIRPMNKRGVVSAYRLEILHQGVPLTRAELGRWAASPHTEALPRALWGVPLTRDDRFVQNPTTPGAELLPDRLCGLTVSAPAPELSDVLGPVPGRVLMVEYIDLPEGPAQMPLHEGVAPSDDFAGVYNDRSVGEILGIAAAGRKRVRIYEALACGGIYRGRSDAMTEMAVQAETLFCDAPLTLTGEES
ncbi:DUF6603 domain-containing protein [Methanoculleus sp.]|uniref:DUF6603 domain-containing protein n=1 Tax=Methanoculleus sp. TaxID=90427 RepID=UPI001BD3B5D9|nr:DUF6603 domain-containing protein [Methanoculleus sp.]MDK2989413.1 hypothetical protein [Methanoculleus sp.]